MTATGRVRAYLGVSLDEHIAGLDDELGWLEEAPDRRATAPPPTLGSEAIGYERLMADVGALLMGRRTFDVVAGFEGGWPYGDLPVLVATHRPLDPHEPAP